MSDVNSYKSRYKGSDIDNAIYAIKQINGRLSKIEETNLQQYDAIDELSEKFENYSHPVESVNGKTGIINLTANDIMYARDENVSVQVVIDNLSAETEEIKQSINNVSKSPVIIDVFELPTENINENAFYRLAVCRLVINREIRSGWNCHIVETLPESGVPCIQGDLADDTTWIVTVYYNVAGNETFGYVDDVLSSVFSSPAGWYPISILLQALGWEYAGEITDIKDSLLDNKFRLLGSYVMHWYKNGKWTNLESIGWRGSGVNAEIFNNLDNIASGVYSHAEGRGTEASGNYSHAEGYVTTASGPCSHAEGYDTEASGYSSHAEGYDTTAEGDDSHAEGNNTTAEGDSSHAEGAYTSALGEGSHSEGLKTVAASDHQHVQGKYNIEDAENKYAHIVGNGEYANPSNAHTLDWNGVAWFAGGLKVGGTGQDDENAIDILDISGSADWSVNNPDTPGYVKNRTHYTEQSPSITWDGSTEGRNSFDASSIELGTFYKISDDVWTRYECNTATVSSKTDSFYVRRSELFYDESIGTVVQIGFGADYYIFIASAIAAADLTDVLGLTIPSAGLYAFVVDWEFTYPLTITPGEVVTKLPSKYLPDEALTIADITPESDFQSLLVTLDGDVFTCDYTDIDYEELKDIFENKEVELDIELTYGSTAGGLCNGRYRGRFTSTTDDNNYYSCSWTRTVLHNGENIEFVVFVAVDIGEKLMTAWAKTLKVEEGKTPIKGVDYYTEADKQEMVDLVLSAIPNAMGVDY